MRSAPRMTVVSLGGGVQSTVMALMAGGGAFGRAPDCAIFADTGWEPPTIYEHLDWLADKLRFPLHVVDSGRSLREDAKALVNRNFLDMPVYLKGTDGSGDGMGRRQCTEHYKVRPIRRKIRRLLGLRKRQRIPSGTTVELWLGISTDEAIRMRTSRDRWIRNRYPLIESGMSRQDCLAWWEARYDRPLEEVGLRRLPLPVPPEMGRDETAVPGAVPRSGGDRLEHAGPPSLRQGALPAPPADTPCRGCESR